MMTPNEARQVLAYHGSTALPDLPRLMEALSVLAKDANARGISWAPDDYRRQIREISEEVTKSGRAVLDAWAALHDQAVLEVQMGWDAQETLAAALRGARSSTAEVARLLREIAEQQELAASSARRLVESAQELRRLSEDPDAGPVLRAAGLRLEEP